MSILINVDESTWKYIGRFRILIYIYININRIRFKFFCKGKNLETLKRDSNPWLTDS